MKTKVVIYAIIIAILLISNAVIASAYSDVPPEHWAVSVIDEANRAGIIYGREDGTFGLGDTVKRSEFAAMLVRLMKWDKSTPAVSTFSDVNADEWYFADVNTLAEHNVFNEPMFRPNDNITRREMAVMLIRALGYSELAQSETNSVFDDVSADGGYISVAHTLGIINGKAENIFDPEGLALREEGAAMMMRMYDKYTSSLNEIHGFYAISSWGQKEIAEQMDTVSFGWGRLQYTNDNAVLLNLSSDGGNDWCLPDGAQDATDYMRSNGVSINFAVTMTDNKDCVAILLNPENRSEAISQILSVSESFDGVTIDFEGMKGAELKTGFNEFIRELKLKLGDRKLYVAVHPVLKHSNEYYDAYDYKTLGEYADRIILMAHDYAAYTLPDNLLNTDFIATPVTPFDEVFTALKAVTNQTTGVSDKGKILLALNTAAATAWNTTDKKITDGTAIHPSIDTVQKRLEQPDTEIIYSQTYKNPYAFYTTESGQQILLWYEDSRSIRDKIDLAKMFGINGVSIWRIGAVANGNAEQYMDVWNTILSE